MVFNCWIPEKCLYPAYQNQKCVPFKDMTEQVPSQSALHAFSKPLSTRPHQQLNSLAVYPTYTTAQPLFPAPNVKVRFCEKKFLSEIG